MAKKVVQRSWAVVSSIVWWVPKNYLKYLLNDLRIRAVTSLSLPGGQDKNISSSVPHFPLFSHIFPQFCFIFFLNLAFRVGESTTWEGPGYTTAEDRDRTSMDLKFSYHFTFLLTVLMCDFHWIAPEFKIVDYVQWCLTNICMDLPTVSAKEMIYFNLS